MCFKHNVFPAICYVGKVDYRSCLSQLKIMLYFVYHFWHVESFVEDALSVEDHIRTNIVHLSSPHAQLENSSHFIFDKS